MKLSIVTAILDSHEIVRRQILHYSRMNLPEDVEIVWVDDGSNPPISVQHPRIHLLRTGNKTPWSEHAARNLGAHQAGGEFLFFIDIDYVIPKKTIEQVLQFNGDRMDIRRQLGVLDECGQLQSGRDTLTQWRAREKWIGTYIPGHRSQFVMRHGLFWDIGGYREDLAGAAHPTGGGAGNKFHGAWRAWKRRGKATLANERANVYMFPSGKFCLGNVENPSGLFHNLGRAASA